MISFSLLLTTEVYDVSHRMIGILQPMEAENPEIASVLSRIQPVFERFDKALFKERKSPYTKILEEADRKRDDSFLALRYYLVSCTHRTDVPEYREPAARLLELIRRHNWSAHRSGYTEESTILGSMLTELAEENNVQAQTAIGAAVMVDALKIAQQEFAQVMSEKTETEAQDDTGAAYLIRKEMEAVLEKTFAFVDSLADFTGENKWIILKTTLDEMAAQVMAIARARSSRGDSDDPDTPEQPEE